MPEIALGWQLCIRHATDATQKWFNCWCKIGKKLVLTSKPQTTKAKLHLTSSYPRPKRGLTVPGRIVKLRNWWKTNIPRLMPHLANQKKKEKKCSQNDRWPQNMLKVLTSNKNPNFQQTYHLWRFLSSVFAFSFTHPLDFMDFMVYLFIWQSRLRDILYRGIFRNVYNRHHKFFRFRRQIQTVIVRTLVICTEEMDKSYQIWKLQSIYTSVQKECLNNEIHNVNNEVKQLLKKKESASDFTPLTCRFTFYNGSEYQCQKGQA